MTRIAPKVAELFETMEYGPAPEAADEARAWIAERGPRFGHYIGGAWCEPAEGEFFATLDPSNEEQLGEVAQGGPADVDRAVAAARAAQAAWRDLGGHGRARYLYAIARHVQKHARHFATLETLDNGKPIRESRDIDIPLVARHFYHHAGWAQLMESELAGYEPLGVAGQIIPWNFPLLMLAWKIAPALATGNTVVLKPAEFTSLTALRFAELCREIELPPGVVNIVTGDGRTGAAIVEHPDVDKIAFTGSTEVGRIIRETTAGTGKKISLELGGKSPFVVFDDADLDSVVEGVVDAIWFNQGEVCCAGSRILAHEGIADALADRLRARMETLRMGDPLDKGVDIGAIIAPVQLKKIESLVEEGREEGATIWQPSWSAPRSGWFYPPTLCTDVSPAATIAQVEIFGPVVVQMTFRTPAEAVALANNTRYGLAASVWTENVNLALDIASQIKAGTVWINCTNAFDAASGFGGYRESGFGREGGREGLREYVRQRPEPVEPGPGDDPVSLGVGDEGDSDEGAPGRAPSAAVDRTAKLYIGGRQARPDGGYSLKVIDHRGRAAGEVARGNRKDARNAVEAALATEWARTTAHLRAQILYYAGENLDARRAAFEDRLRALTGCDAEAARREVEASVRRLFSYAAWADKWDGAVHRTPFRNVTLAMPEPLGVMAVVCPPEPALLGFISAVIPPVSLGNSVVAVASERWPLPATDFQQVIETSDVPAGVINILTGLEEELLPTLAGHDAVDGMWYFGTPDGAADVERRSASNLKRTWVSAGRGRDWFGAGAEGREFLRHASQIKNIWVPYGE
ncbi:aldehyde dehydrogenase family protein [Candidatus Palauibacter sp.]|uniref:aldehyde dehydrogenase family protein n=1 Tax=Candidatus Palauibacter sp. TaxID=3101350 RepID=UPI003B52AEDD